ncbi:MAG: flagellar basal body rod C-terminal domain-containing protein [Pirellulales bacterium]
MGLSSVMQVGLTGLAAAELTLDTVANNLANLNTASYKQSFPRFATQTPATHSRGEPRSGSNGGTNPVQVGRGVQAAEVAVDLSSGALATTGDSNELSLEAGTRELSNTDLGENMVQMLLAGNQFRANRQVIGTASELLDDLVELRRR